MPYILRYLSKKTHNKFQSMVNQMHDNHHQEQHQNFNTSNKRYQSKEKQKDFGEYIDYEEVE